MEKGNSSLSAMQWKFFDNAMKISVFFFFLFFFSGNAMGREFAKTKETS